MQIGVEVQIIDYIFNILIWPPSYSNLKVLDVAIHLSKYLAPLKSELAPLKSEVAPLKSDLATLKSDRSWRIW